MGFATASLSGPTRAVNTVESTVSAMITAAREADSMGRCAEVSGFMYFI